MKICRTTLFWKECSQGSGRKKHLESWKKMLIAFSDKFSLQSKTFSFQGNRPGKFYLKGLVQIVSCQLIFQRMKIGKLWRNSGWTFEKKVVSVCIVERIRSTKFRMQGRSAKILFVVGRFPRSKKCRLRLWWKTSSRGFWENVSLINENGQNCGNLLPFQGKFAGFVGLIELKNNAISAKFVPNEITLSYFF